MSLQQIEDFGYKCAEMMSRLGKIRDSLNKAEIPDSVDMAKVMLDEHKGVQKRISKAPIEALEAESHAILEKIRGSRHQSQGVCTCVCMCDCVCVCKSGRETRVVRALSNPAVYSCHALGLIIC